jgi:hypothetical protein
MNPEDIRPWLQRRPFKPFRTHLSDGRHYDILHPEFVLLLRTRLEIGLADDSTSLIPNRAEDCFLLHIVSLEELPPGIPSSSAPANA